MTTEAAPAPIANATPVGASDIGNFTGPAAAAQRMDDLKADPKFMERVKTGEASAFDEYNKAWRVAHGLPPTPLPPASPVDIEKEADARTVAAVQQHGAVLRQQGFTEEQIIDIVGRRPITMEECEFHQNEIALLKKDPEFVRRYLAGGYEEGKRMRRHQVALSLPTGTLDDIKRWGG